MGEKCCGCNKEFVAGDNVLTFYMERVLKGQKSGVLGFYESANSLGTENEGNIDHVHFLPGCLELAFSPPDNPFMFDVLAEQVRQKIYEEESERDPADILPTLPEMLVDPPYCLWCKRTDTVWLHTDKGYPIFNCLACKKLWDQDDDELCWDQEIGDYFLAHVERKQEDVWPIDDR